MRFIVGLLLIVVLFWSGCDLSPDCRYVQCSGNALFFQAKYRGADGRYIIDPAVIEKNLQVFTPGSFSDTIKHRFASITPVKADSAFYIQLNKQVSTAAIRWDSINLGNIEFGFTRFPATDCCPELLIIEEVTFKNVDYLPNTPVKLN